LDGKSLKLFNADVVEKEGNPGEIIEVTKKTFTVACGKDALVIRNLQPEGKKPMDTVAFLNGNKIEVGMKLNS
jgi:methionyl-tRNA formyltransferase